MEVVRFLRKSDEPVEMALKLLRPVLALWSPY